MIPTVSVLAVLHALSPVSAAQDGARAVEIRAREVWTGTERIQNGAVVVVDGRIRSVGTAREPDPRRAIAQYDGVLTAGMVVCQSEAGAGDELRGDARTLLPEGRAWYAFAPEHSDFRRALEAGITSMALTPNGNGLVGGLSSVVKTAGGRVLAREATLAMSLSSEAIGRATGRVSFVFGSAEAPLASADGGPENTTRTGRGTRTPTSYSGAVAVLEEAFAAPAGPLARARRGELPVTIEAFDRHEVMRALGLATKLGLHGAIRGAPLASDPTLVEALKASGMGLVVGPYDPDQTRASLESLAALAKAKVPVGFALEAPARSPEELRLFAARAMWAGAPHDALWRALTVDAAHLAGVGDHVGAVAPDRDADLVLWSGDPLDLSSRIEAVWVDGRLAWKAPSESTATEGR